jgi:hypothetical protein
MAGILPTVDGERKRKPHGPAGRGTLQFALMDLARTGREIAAVDTFALPPAGEPLTPALVLCHVLISG